MSLLPEADRLPSDSDTQRRRPFSQVAVQCPLSQNPVVSEVAGSEVLGRPCPSGWQCDDGPEGPPRGWVVVRTGIGCVHGYVSQTVS